MLRLIFRRLIAATPNLFGVVVITFLLTRALPGDPAAYFAGGSATREAIEQVRQLANAELVDPVEVHDLVFAIAVVRRRVERQVDAALREGAVLGVALGRDGGVEEGRGRDVVGGERGHVAAFGGIGFAFAEQLVMRRQRVIVARDRRVRLQHHGFFVRSEIELQPVSGLVGLSRRIEQIEQIVPQLIADAVGDRLDIDIAQRRPDIALAQKLLGWKPKVSLYDGLAKTVDWFKGLGR